MVPELAETHFPACMSVLQNTLKTSHHLKYKGRLQYGLFLKGEVKSRLCCNKVSDAAKKRKKKKNIHSLNNLLHNLN